MDTTTTLLGIGFFLLFMLPILWIVLKQSNRTNYLKNSLKNFGTTENLEFSEIEITHRAILAMTANKEVLVFATITNDKKSNIDFQKIPINKHAKFTIETTQTKGDGITYIALKKHDDKQEPIVFYDDDTDLGTDALTCLQVAKKWEKLLN